MRKGTSGLLLTENADGSLRVEYVDYGVGFFGDSDYEVWYTIDTENAQKLRDYLSQKHAKGTLQEQMKAEFGKNLSEKKFQGVCRRLGVELERNSWVSHDFDYGDLDD